MSQATATEAPAHAPNPGARAALPRGPLDAWLRQGQAWLQTLEQVYRLQQDTAHLALEGLRELRGRLERSADGSSVLALPAGLMQVQAAATLRFVQELSDIGMRNLGDAGSQVVEAALRSTPAWPRAEALRPLGLPGMGGFPAAGWFEAALNRHLMPNTAA